MINDYALTNSSALSAGLPAYLFPRARRTGQSLRIGNLKGDSGSSLWICLRTGSWKDHASGDSGGDVISLYAAKMGLSQRQALQDIRTFIQDKPPLPPEHVASTKDKGDDEKRVSLALKIWKQGQDIQGTPVAHYLKSRGLECYSGMPIKFHPTCPRGRDGYPAQLALMTDAISGKEYGIHRTFLKPDGDGKADFSPNKMMLGRSKDAVIRLIPDDEVTTGLGIVEGIENGLAILGIGWRPVWVALSSGGISSFPILQGIEALTIFADNDKAGLNAANDCARRWTQAGKEVTIRTPLNAGHDWNDVAMGIMS